MPEPQGNQNGITWESFCRAVQANLWDDPAIQPGDQPALWWSDGVVYGTFRGGCVAIDEHGQPRWDAESAEHNTIFAMEMDLRREGPDADRQARS